VRRQIVPLWMISLIFIFPTGQPQSPTPQTPLPTTRGPFTVKLKLADGTRFEKDVADVPYIADSEVHIFAGESFGLNATISDGEVSQLAYQKNSKKADIELSFSQQKSLMILMTNNKLKRELHFDALITLPGETRTHATSTIRIRPGLSSFESWPYPILELTLRNFQLLR
jgi:hypothetical protein